LWSCSTALRDRFSPLAGVVLCQERDNARPESSQGTAAALVLYGILIAEAGASRALVITYINPLIAVALGITILGERPGIGAAAGLPLILAGSWLSTRGHRPTTGSLARSSTRVDEQRHTAGRLFTNDGDTLSYGLRTRGRHHDDLDGREARPSTTAGSAPILVSDRSLSTVTNR
jgi:EamA-like transporter family